MTDKPSSPSSFKQWRKRNRQRLQSTALLLAVLSPFGLYAALQAGLGWVAIACFTLVALAELLTIFSA